MAGRLSGCRVGITSGPTRAWIDPVRFVANASTGELGALLGDGFVAAGAKVDYVVGPGGKIPNGGSVRLHPVESPPDLVETLETLSRSSLRDPFHIWVHAMAVLDYVPAESHSEKIPSGSETLELSLVPTPKVILLFRPLFPDAFLVGFKLATTDREEILRSEATDLAEKAGCHLVVANTAPFRDPSHHTAYLWEPGTSRWVGPFTGKPTIAREIVHWVAAAAGGKCAS